MEFCRRRSVRSCGLPCGAGAGRGGRATHNGDGQTAPCWLYRCVRLSVLQFPAGLKGAQVRMSGDGAWARKAGAGGECREALARQRHELRAHEEETA